MPIVAAVVAVAAAAVGEPIRVVMAVQGVLSSEEAVAVVFEWRPYQGAKMVPSNLNCQMSN